MKKLYFAILTLFLTSCEFNTSTNITDAGFNYGDFKVKCYSANEQILDTDRILAYKSIGFDGDYIFKAKNSNKMEVEVLVTNATCIIYKQVLSSKLMAYDREKHEQRK